MCLVYYFTVVVFTVDNYIAYYCYTVACVFDVGTVGTLIYCRSRDLFYCTGSILCQLFNIALQLGCFLNAVNSLVIGTWCNSYLTLCDSEFNVLDNNVFKVGGGYFEVSLMITCGLAVTAGRLESALASIAMSSIKSPRIRAVLI